MIGRVSQQSVTAPDGSLVVVVTPGGELDLSTIAALEGAVSAALTSAGSPPKLVIDLSDVDVVHAFVLGVFLDARRRCRAASGSLTLVVADDGVASVFVAAGVDGLFATSPDLQTAVGGQ